MVQIPENLDDWSEYPGMVHWFSPRVLFKVVQKVIASSVFGQYADKRLVHASLDVLLGNEAEKESEWEKRCGGKNGICTRPDGPIWLDYVADLGDGFDSTYAIAYLLGQEKIDVDGTELPRADCLIMGGDEVYPDASRDDYWKRMQRPYECAFPRTNSSDAKRPPVFLIPGNHDWYDGLTLFLAKFCRGRDTHLGSWNAVQARSYFAFQLKDNWWAWGYDSQLGEDIDKPQADYFVAVAKRMKPGAKVILCAPVPSWLRADEATKAPNDREVFYRALDRISSTLPPFHRRLQKQQTDKDAEQRTSFYRGLDYMAGILKKDCQGSKVPLVLSGDLHHYSRYVAEEAGTNFVTAGGGGAFLHPTHHLPSRISATWVGTDQSLKIANSDAYYPPRKASRNLAWRNFGFVLKNPLFCVTLGVFYWISALVLLAPHGYGASGGTGPFLDRVSAQISDFMPTPAFVLVAGAFLMAIIHYADIQHILAKYVIGTVHALVHITLVTIATGLVSVLAFQFASLPLGEILYFLALGVGMVGSGFVGGFVWGLYLLIVSFGLGQHANDAFSAMRLDSYRHFLRMKIEGDSLTVFPIGIDESPKRSDWKKNEDFTENDQNTPFFVPKNSLGQHFIEEPVVIDAARIEPLQSVT